MSSVIAAIMVNISWVEFISSVSFYLYCKCVRKLRLEYLEVSLLQAMRGLTVIRLSVGEAKGYDTHTNPLCLALCLMGLTLWSRCHSWMFQLHWEMSYHSF
jgi:hypothetical protein